MLLTISFLALYRHLIINDKVDSSKSNKYFQLYQRTLWLTLIMFDYIIIMSIAR